MTVATTYNLAPVPRWLFTDLTGKILSNGYMYTYQDLNRVVQKVAYKDPAGANPWTDPVPFELNGMPDGALYWASDSNYYLAVFDKNDVPQFTVEKYNAPFADQINTAPKPLTNFFRNPQFTFWTNTNDFPGISSSVDILDYVADDWLYFRNNNNATVNISQELFNSGQTDVPFNPVGYFRYECTNAGSGGLTYNAWAQTFQSVQTLAGQQVTIAFWARSSTLSNLSFRVDQYFGTGGSASAPTSTSLYSTTLTSTWQQYFFTATIPNINSKTLGTNGDDYLQLQFDFPLNTIATIDLCNVQGQLGAVLSDFLYLTQDDQQKRLNTLANGIARTGDFKFTLRLGNDPGWVSCNNQTIGNSFSNANVQGIYTKALFILLWNNVNNTWAPILNGDGSPGVRGASAEADYNANKRLTLTPTVGKVLAQYSSPTYVMGQTDGSYTHTMTLAELVPHEHNLPATFENLYASGSGESALTTEVPSPGTNTGTTGGGAPFSIVQPTLFVNCMIKF